MAQKTGLERTANAAFHIKAIKDIIKAFLHGGWHAAALQVIKHYWPQILAVILVLLMIPLIVFCCLPMTTFGFESSADTEIAAMTAQADLIATLYDRYEEYLQEQVETIKSSALKNTSSEVDSLASTETAQPEYEIEFVGTPIQKNWFIALHTVSVGNDLSKASEENIRDFSRKCITYSTIPPREQPEISDTITASSCTEADTPENYTLQIRYLTPDEIMAACSFSASDINWVQLIHSTLETTHQSDVGELGSLFSDFDWRDHITSGYGYRTFPSSGFHSGVDIGMPAGTNICVVRSGTVKSVVYSTSGYGFHLIIDHGDGIETLYAHCSRILVSEGQAVTQGDIIAQVGSTGNSTGPHCHFEVRLNEKSIDPLPYLP